MKRKRRPENDIKINDFVDSSKAIQGSSDDEVKKKKHRKIDHDVYEEREEINVQEEEEEDKIEPEEVHKKSKKERRRERKEREKKEKLKRDD